MEYTEKVRQILDRLENGSAAAIAQASEVMCEAIAQGHPVHIFGSGHSVIPVLDVFPRYGSFVGFHPLMDPRLMWQTVLGPGGAPGLLWLERQEGYIQHFLDQMSLRAGDVMLVFSHGGLNAAPVEAALYARDHGLTVVAVTSLANAAQAKATHSSGLRLAGIADIVIDNQCPPEDAVVWPAGSNEPFAAGSTVAAVTVVGALVSEVGRRLIDRGIHPVTFVSPNVAAVGPEHNREVFQAYRAFIDAAASRPGERSADSKTR